MSSRLPLHQWLSEGVRAGFFLRPRIGGEQPAPAQVAALLAIFAILEVGLARFEVGGSASFDLHGWLAPWWSTAALVLLAWWALPPRDSPDALQGLNGVAAWFALWMGAVFPANLVSQLLGIAQAQELLPTAIGNSDWAAWLIYLALLAWTIAAGLRLAARFGTQRRRLTLLAFGLIALFALSAWQFPERPWQSDDAGGGVTGERVQLAPGSMTIESS